MRKEEQGFRQRTAVVAVARGLNGQSAVIFVTHGSLLDMDLDQLQEGLKVEWFNPLTAERRQAAPREDGYFQPPSRDDWMLVVG